MKIEARGAVKYSSDGVMGENAQCRGSSASIMEGYLASPVAGFTLLEVLIAIALGLVILAGLFRTFKVQQDSYLLQDQVSTMQQNLRGAMYLITRDLQMAGYYTNLDRNNRQMDWNDLDGDSNPTTNMETGKPLLFGVNNVPAGTGVDIKDNTDVIVIVKASMEEGRALGSGEGASASSISLNPPDYDLTKGMKYGVLVKNDLSYAELFHLDSSGNITPPLTENYTANDRVHRADIIIYKVDDSTPTRPCLVRKNLGSDNGYQVIAENIDNLQFRYQLVDGTWPNDPAGNQARVRAVEVLLIARTALPQKGYRDTNSIPFGDTTIPAPNDHYRRKALNSIVKTRNVGL